VLRYAVFGVEIRKPDGAPGRADKGTVDPVWGESRLAGAVTILRRAGRQGDGGKAG
jgi:hypothetical protein